MDDDSVVGSNNRGPDAQPFQALERDIFREEARRHYLQNADKVELPKIVSPKYFIYLWIISLVLMAVGMIVTFWPLIRQWQGG